jgi:hypothetical protein
MDAQDGYTSRTQGNGVICHAEIRCACHPERQSPTTSASAQVGCYKCIITTVYSSLSGRSPRRSGHIGSTKLASSQRLDLQNKLLHVANLAFCRSDACRSRMIESPQSTLRTAAVDQCTEMTSRVLELPAMVEYMGTLREYTYTAVRVLRKNGF